MSELVHTSSKQCDRPLNFSDRNIGHDLSSATVCVRTSKTNQSGPPVFLRIPSEACNIICPVRALIKFLHNRPPGPGLLFVHENYRPLTRYQFNAVLTKTIKYLNLPLKIIYKGFFKSFIVLYADRICPEHHFVENRIKNSPSV